MESKLFSPVTFGPLTLRNRTIRSAAFESMCPENTPTQMLLDYHRSVAAGGGCFCAGCARQQILFSAGEPVVQSGAVRLCAAGTAGGRDQI